MLVWTIFLLLVDVSVQKENVAVQPKRRRSCWQGAFAQMKWACCNNRDAWQGCWDGDFTFERCCVHVPPPGDVQCWQGGYSYDACCFQATAWTPRHDCFDGAYSFERCCGGYKAMLLHEVRKRVMVWYKQFMLYKYGLWTHFVFGALTIRVIAWVSSTSTPSRSSAQSIGHARHSVPAATALRVWAVCGVVGYHSMGKCGHSRVCNGLGAVGMGNVGHIMNSFFVIHTDIFFVLAAYLASLHVSTATVQNPDLPIRVRVRIVVVDTASSILSRVARTAPTFVLKVILKCDGWKDLFRMADARYFAGISWPGGMPGSWPYGVELLCLSAVRILLLIMGCLGDGVGIAATIVVIGFSLEQSWRAKLQTVHKPAIEWHAFHFSVGGHRLLLSLTALLLSRLIQRFPGKAHRRTSADSGSVNGTVQTTSKEATEAEDLAAIRRVPEDRSVAGVASTSSDSGSEQALHMSASPSPADTAQGVADPLEAKQNHSDGSAVEKGKPHIAASGTLDVDRRQLGNEIGSGMKAGLVFAWVLFFVCLCITAGFEWCWTYGPRKLLPRWAYPFPVKLPLVFSCVILLEVSRRVAITTNSFAPPFLRFLERRSLGVLVLHEFVEHKAVFFLPYHERDWLMFWYQLPGLLVCSFIAASAFLCTEEPFRRPVESTIVAARAAAKRSGLVGNVVGFIMLGASGLIVCWTFHAVCIRDWPELLGSTPASACLV